MIPHNRPWITAEDRQAVDAVLASGWIAQGPQVLALERFFVEHQGGGEACAVSSGSSALLLALQACGAGAGDAVIVPTYACSALVNAVHMAGARPVVVDVRMDDFCLDPASVDARPAASRFAIAVHAFGARADVGALQALGLSVIEDCCQSLGGLVDGRPLGGDGAAAVYSFYASKIVTGGQGGLVWSRDAGLVAHVRDYRQFDGRENYVPRFNFQMTDLQAAMVVSQLARLDTIRDRRAAARRAIVAALPAGFAAQADVDQPGRMAHRCVVVAQDLRARDALAAHLHASGIGCIVPVERFELLHRYLGLDPAAYPVAEALADRTLSLPVFPALESDALGRIVDALHRFHP